MPTQNINVGKGLVPQIELFGDWNKALALFNTLPEAVKLGANNGSVKAAKKIRLMVRKNIKSNHELLPTAVNRYCWIFVVSRLFFT